MKKLLFAIIMLLTINIALAQDSDWIVNSNYLYPYSIDYYIGIGTQTPGEKLTVLGGNVSIEKEIINYRHTSDEICYVLGGYGSLSVCSCDNIANDQDCANPFEDGNEEGCYDRAYTYCSGGEGWIFNSTPIIEGGSLSVEEKVQAKELCDETGSNCRDLSDDWPSSSSLYELDNPNSGISPDLYVDDLGNTKSDSGQICDLNGCIGDMANNWSTNGANLFYNLGLIGIGTNNPNAELHLANAVGAVLKLERKEDEPGNNEFIGGIEFIGLDDDSERQTITGIKSYTTYDFSDSTGGELLFYTRKNTDSDIQKRMTIDEEGKVGIGTEPTEALDVSGNTKISGSLNANKLTIDGTTIDFNNGAQIIANGGDFIIKLP